MDNKTMISFQPVGITGAGELAMLAQEIYREHYLHLWHPGGAEWYMYEKAYHPDIITEELSNPFNQYYFIYENNALTGYLKLVTNAVFNKENNCLEIERIYLRKQATGKGIGKAAMQFAETIARSNHAETIFLKAMDSSLDAIRFYQRMGYRISGSFRLSFPLMKESYRGMHILHKKIPC
jgi:GNAT superfamily N-acetyltransferase